MGCYRVICLLGIKFRIRSKYLMLRERIKNLENAYNRTRNFRHDIKNHMLTLNILAENGNVEEIKKAEGKNTYKGLDKAFVEKYISIQINADDLNKQYAKASEMGKFPLVRKWFLNTFKNFDMETAKAEIEQAIFAEIAAATEKKPAVLTMTEMKSAS